MSPDFSTEKLSKMLDIKVMIFHVGGKSCFQ
ncbi:hypothetical protein F383_26749 [Gossypium arboreum]|uniref:Uncharacterized protein n=1 Tax=Gossypium arboreum TaxID=29729 RepID=A0A0B0P628_GOSAR|nr:hypothetical protein F383_26749 [Gossypium arboreum]